ncbi:unnamed protein product [Effrenium voratum]|nr:unnamed protein product [Effrenium voratum]
MTRLLLLSLFGLASAFVAPSPRLAPHGPASLVEASAKVGAQADAPSQELSSWSSCLLAGLSIGYAAAAGKAFQRAKISCQAEKASVARTPVAYPIFTFRWLAIHALVVPTVFFLGAISSMQFIQR